MPMDPHKSFGNDFLRILVITNHSRNEMKQGPLMALHEFAQCSFLSIGNGVQERKIQILHRLNYSGRLRALAAISRSTGCFSSGSTSRTAKNRSTLRVCRAPWMR